MTSIQVNTNSEEYHHIIDQRSPAQKTYQNQVAQEIVTKNLKFFNVKMTHRRKVKYQVANLFRVDLGKGWYANITDNCRKSEQTIFTMHGSPGDHVEWAGLETEMWDSCRWVNFVLPGYDGEDERRGNYSGSVEDISEMIIRIIKIRNLRKIIFCGHSMGSILASYFINRYPQYVEGYINITGIVNIWYTGLLTFYRVTLAAYGFNKGPNKKALLRLLNKNEFREKHHSRFIEETRDVYFGPVQFPNLTVTQMCAYIKLFSSIEGGSSQLYQLNEKINLLRVLIFGKKDPLHEQDKTNEQIYYITRGEGNFYKRHQKLLQDANFQDKMNQQLERQHGLKLDVTKLQQYFCYHFDDTGHNAHKRRPKQISKVLKVYLTVLKVMHKYQDLQHSKL